LLTIFCRCWPSFLKKAQCFRLVDTNNKWLFLFAAVEERYEMGGPRCAALAPPFLRGFRK
jgi:hypothetical protein